ncbi:MAG: 16S rRNA (cytosine(1402)-N(4))-methyltransferase RsmH, partial [Chitinophagales bacterium]|nr:16S rRNA (cytosine(1402)-N(4))-methyltransferase RsmH [Chitinophagales bacterium]
FRHMKNMLRLNGITSADGILADLGISSYQIDTAERGFAHRLQGPLDMRMNKSLQHNAEDILNSYDHQQLQHMFGEYGQVRNARTLANTISAARNRQEIETIEDFIKVITPVIKGNHNKYLSQVFQALRIEVNDELNALKEFLEQAKEILETGGRLVVISYHSLEDRIIKNFIRHGNTMATPDKDPFGGVKKHFKAINKKPIIPGEDEIKKNNRAHSARMRIAEKV